MLNAASGISQNLLNRLVAPVSLVGLLSSMGLLSGWAPGLSQDFTTVVFDTATYAQSTVNNTQIIRYAQSVLEIEPVRKEEFAKVRQVMKGNVPANVCRQDGLPEAVATACKSFFSRSADIIRKNKLSIGEFNQITQQVQSDSGLKVRIQKELIRQQQN